MGGILAAGDHPASPEIDSTSGILLDRDAQRGWSEQEVEREIGCDIRDSLARLYAAGLLHRLQDFVWATRAALAAEATGVYGWPGKIRRRAPPLAPRSALCGWTGGTARKALRRAQVSTAATAAQSSAGEFNVSFSMMLKLADGLGVPVHELVQRAEASASPGR